jgi:hypothetical protein
MCKVFCNIPTNASGQSPAWRSVPSKKNVKLSTQGKQMNRTAQKLIVSAAMAGLVSGAVITITGCNSDNGSASASSSSSKHDCKGMNSCKGQGNCSAGDMGCKGKNSCKGKGGCKTA